LQHQPGAPIEGAAALHSDPTSHEQFPVLNQCDGVLDRQRFSAVLKITRNSGPVCAIEWTAMIWR
jgi:hypothetical protein